jgi:hypothetical protein
MFESFGALLVVEGPGSRRGCQGGEGLGVQRVDQPVVVDEAGHDDLLLARRAGDRAGGRVVPAGLAVAVTVRVVAELAEYPGAEDLAQSGLGQVDLSVRVPPKMLLHLPLCPRTITRTGAPRWVSKCRAGLASAIAISAW